MWQGIAAELDSTGIEMQEAHGRVHDVKFNLKNQWYDTDAQTLCQVDVRSREHMHYPDPRRWGSARGRGTLVCHCQL
jgi:hypothetical protein